MKKKITKLHKAAKKFQERSYSKYSRVKVSAAIMFSDGSIIEGANVENLSYGATVCAERVAVWRALMEGKKDFELLYLFTPGEPWTPCGMCLQVLIEFCSPDMPIIIGTYDREKEKVYRLSDFMPMGLSSEGFTKNQT